MISFKPIIPSPHQYKEVKMLARNAMRRVAAGLHKEFNKTVADWDKPAVFKEHTSVRDDSGYLTAAVDTDNEVWIMQELGTPPHTITAEGGGESKVLAIPTGFGKGKKSSGKKTGTANMIFVAQVQHPGTQPKQWINQIIKNYAPIFLLQIKKMIEEIRKTSNRAQP